MVGQHHLGNQITRQCEEQRYSKSTAGDERPAEVKAHDGDHGKGAQTVKACDVLDSPLIVFPHDVRIVGS